MQSIEEIINTGFSLHQIGRLDEAENIYRQVLTSNAENAEACNLMGVLKLQQGDIEIAVEWIEKALSLKECEYFYETLFQAYIRNNNFDKIIEHAQAISKSYPKNFSLLFNIALAYKSLKFYSEAIAFYDKALKINPSSYQAWFNIANLYTLEGQYKNAASAMKICKKLKPNDSETDYFYAISLMQIKDYNKGLKLFESRICRETALAVQNKTYPNLASMDRLWRGENIKNKTLFVYYEAGFGDVIMFSRYLPLLKKLCKKVVFYPQRQLVPLFVDSKLGIDEVIDGFIPEHMLDFDVHVPLMSLPYLLKLKGNNVFYKSGGYIGANQELAEEYREKHFNNDKIKIGIKWRGNTYFETERVIPTEAFAPLFDIKNSQFYSFQTFEGSEDISKLSERFDIVDIGKDLIDFGQTAAAMANLDLVICNDTSLAHLAGAMGIPCFVMLPNNVNWRWHDGKGISDWYDSIHLFRQKENGNWDSVIEEIKNTIQSYIKKIEQDKSKIEKKS